MSRAIIITGMHRSGTSLISSLLQRAGIHVGEKLLAGNSANPRGYFEDVDFYEFQEHLLHERGQTYLYVDNHIAFEPSAAEAGRARQLIAERSHRPLWGWKDPRTSLFLFFWQQLLPDARFLLVYRHPIEVLLSLLRRGEFDSHPSPMAGLHAWLVYNSNIQAFCDQHRDRCLLVHIAGVVKHATKFSQLLRKKLQINSSLSPQAFAQIYHSTELQQTPFSSELDILLASICPQLLELYEQLNRQADLPSDEIQVDSTASQPLSPLVHFNENLAEPISLPVKYSLLQMLLSTLAPELTERMLVRFNESAKASQHKVDDLWLLAQQYQRLNAEQEQELCRRSTQIAEQQQELDRQSVQIESLTAELSSIYDTHIGRVMRSYRNL
ncbi:MAG: sulfotransferase [Planctomycetes bacterium]|nr:sulfotransferase [Planctomycetota bacterium]